MWNLITAPKSTQVGTQGRMLVLGSRFVARDTYPGTPTRNQKSFHHQPTLHLKMNHPKRAFMIFQLLFHTNISFLQFIFDWMEAWLRLFQPVSKIKERKKVVGWLGGPEPAPNPNNSFFLLIIYFFMKDLLVNYRPHTNLPSIHHAEVTCSWRYGKEGAKLRFLPNPNLHLHENRKHFYTHIHI